MAVHLHGEEEGERGGISCRVSHRQRQTDWSPEEVGLEALEQLARVQLAQEVGGALHVRRLPKLQPGSVALHLPLCVYRWESTKQSPRQELPHPTSGLR